MRITGTQFAPRNLNLLSSFFGVAILSCHSAKGVNRTEAISLTTPYQGVGYGPRKWWQAGEKR